MTGRPRRRRRQTATGRARTLVDRPMRGMLEMPRTRSMTRAKAGTMARVRPTPRMRPRAKTRTMRPSSTTPPPTLHLPTLRPRMAPRTRGSNTTHTHPRMPGSRIRRAATLASFTWRRTARTAVRAGTIAKEGRARAARVSPSSSRPAPGGLASSPRTIRTSTGTRTRTTALARPTSSASRSRSTAACRMTSLPFRTTRPASSRAAGLSTTA